MRLRPHCVRRCHEESLMIMKAMTQNGTAASRRFAPRLEPKAAKCIPAEHLRKAPGISEMNPRIKALLMSDDPLVLEGIKSCLRDTHQFEIVGEADGGLEAIAKPQELKPNIVIM